jgi:RNA polymerase sigma-70 factor (ECF subfamily)
MDENNFLAERFEESRPHLRAVAYRMLGSRGEADDAVQEAWLRLSRSDTDAVDNLGGWLTMVVARICLDMLRARKARREQSFGPDVPEPSVSAEESIERNALLADSVGLALLIVLDKLNPVERVAFVLHDMFDIPFEDIAPIIERSPEATRQLASRARRRVRGESEPLNADFDRQQAVVEAFLAAARGGNFEALLTMLAPEVVMRADATAVRMGGQPELRGAAAVAASFKGRAQAARPARVDGGIGVAVIFGGHLRIVLELTFDGEQIAGIEATADPARIAQFEVEVLQ